MVEVGKELTFTVSVSDPDNDAVTLTMLTDQDAMTGDVKNITDDSQKNAGRSTITVTWKPAGSTFNTTLR